MKTLILTITVLLLASSVMADSEVLDYNDIEDTWIHGSTNSGKNWGGEDYFVTDLIAAGVFLMRINTDDVLTTSVVDSVHITLSQDVGDPGTLDLYLGLTDFTEGTLFGTAPTDTDPGGATWDNTYDSAGTGEDVAWADAGDFGSQDYRTDPLDTVTGASGDVIFGTGADTAVINVFQDFISGDNTIKVLIVAENPDSEDKTVYHRSTESAESLRPKITVWYHAAASGGTRVGVRK